MQEGEEQWDPQAWEEGIDDPCNKHLCSREETSAQVSV